MDESKIEWSIPMESDAVWLVALKDYLRSHESDIAEGINDFADLEPVFVHLFDVNPNGS